jgi:tetratricopeptide (TPR) repeat protein
LSIWKRFFSADYRAAVSAEAAGQLEQAAEHYVLAGEHLEAARVHLARAERAQSRPAEIDALRDALHWAGHHQELGAYIRKALGRALLARARAEGVATERDRQRVHEAAELLVAGGDFLRAGEALESIDDMAGAAMAYGKGGLVERMEAVMARDDERTRRERALRECFANYEMHMRIGDREAARADLRQCIEAADGKAEYRRLLDTLESRLITGSHLVLRRRHELAITVVGAGSLTMGRDPLCELSLRAGGVSRHHAEITIGPPDQAPRFHLRDLGSRNGTRVGGLPIHGAVPLAGTGAFSLGDACPIDYEVHGTPPHLLLRVAGGVDRGQVLVAAGSDEPVDLSEPVGLSVHLRFRDGRPLLSRSGAGVRLLLGGERVAEGAVQLIHGDELHIDGVEVDIP